MTFEPTLVAPNLPELIEGERIVLRTWRFTDAPELWAAVDESRERLGRWMEWLDGHVSIVDSQEYCRRMAAAWAERTNLALGIWSRDERRLLGATGYHGIDWSVPSFEIGYWIREGEEGKGYVTETVRLLTRFAFGPLAAQRLWLTCDVANARSRAVPERLGWVREAYLRNHQRRPDGTLRDTLLYALVPGDPAALSQP